MRESHHALNVALHLRRREQRAEEKNLTFSAELRRECDDLLHAALAAACDDRKEDGVKGEWAAIAAQRELQPQLHMRAVEHTVRVVARGAALEELLGAEVVAHLLSCVNSLFVDDKLRDVPKVEPREVLHPYAYLFISSFHLLKASDF